MKCYYELLDVAQNVEQVDLKKAYYKLSLQWHPDKNTTEDTTVIFQEIQEAYKVLSDPQERAWYDKHRAQILQGNGRGTQMGETDYQESRVDVFQYFTRSCFEKFDDDVKGFYTVYAKVFADITEEEKCAAKFSGCTMSSSESGSDDDEDDCKKYSRRKSRSYPPFGSSSSPYKEVVAPFYLFWEIFETKKTYTWVEKYDTRLADSRQERRAMEAENNRMRMSAIRKRNEEIRQLVAYVKKRDKRVIAENERIQRIAKESQNRTKLLAEKARQREAAQLHEAWNDEIAFGGIASQWSEQFEAEIKRLEAELDGINLDDPLQKSSKANHVITIKNPHNSVNDETDHINKQTQNTNTDNGDNSNDDDDNDDDDDDPVQETINDELYCIACDKLFASIKAKLNHESSKKHKKQLDLLKKLIHEENNILQDHFNILLFMEQSSNNHLINNNSMDNNNNNNNEQSNIKLTKRAKKAERQRKKQLELHNSSISILNEQPNSINELNKDVTNDNNTEIINETSNCELDDPTIQSTINTNNNLNKESSLKYSDQSTIKQNEKSILNSSKINKIICDTCSIEFQSRNALFIHLKQSGHAKLIKLNIPSSSSSSSSSNTKDISNENKKSVKKKRNQNVNCYT
ncbi:DnaJ sub C member 21 [Schistosoma haematobium]|uniref:DnaJ sub C member 21 n=1 Tax=Schistosoma haematobium TaxID=6185 RepID=A0A922IKL2_SCHHA|nr:DnaJ sub C member 21 [Schistosoma haematobium]KAH9581279.1 DnaJ sub C member 21 [Schistosoma haematobium]CAH8622926.1 unnamed protein product [Schistosoma haematobium]CAH8630619.1 unnamed protein product [Schistosoma haematobium]